MSRTLWWFWIIHGMSIIAHNPFHLLRLSRSKWNAVKRITSHLVYLLSSLFHASVPVLVDTICFRLFSLHSWNNWEENNKYSDLKLVRFKNRHIYIWRPLASEFSGQVSETPSWPIAMSVSWYPTKWPFQMAPQVLGCIGGRVLT